MMKVTEPGVALFVDVDKFQDLRLRSVQHLAALADQLHASFKTQEHLIELNLSCLKATDDLLQFRETSLKTVLLLHFRPFQPAISLSNTIKDNVAK